MKCVHCVGLSRTDDNTRVLLLQVRVTRPSRMLLLRVLLDARSVNLTTPFYEHDVFLTSEPTYYVLERWVATRPRLRTTENKSESAYAAGIKNIIRQSFFPLMVPFTGETAEWQRRFYQWDIHRRGLAQDYVAHFDVNKWVDMVGPPPPAPADEAEEEEEATVDDDDGSTEEVVNVSLVNQLNKQGASKGVVLYTVKDYWAKVTAVYRAEWDTLNRTLAIKMDAVVVGSLPYVYGVLDNFRLCHITGYLKNRLLEMPLMQTLESQADSGTHLMSTATLSPGTAQDLLLFYREMESVARGVDPGHALEYHNFSSLIDALVAADKLLSTLAYLLGGAAERARPATPPPECLEDCLASSDDEGEKRTVRDCTVTRGLRREIVHRVLVRKCVADLTRQATESRSTYFPVTVDSVLYYYRRIFGLHSESGALRGRLFFLDTTGDDDAADAEATQFSVDHYEEILSLFLTLTAATGWTRCYESPRKLNQYTPLFMIACKSAVNVTEASIRRLFCATRNHAVAVASSEWCASDWQSACLAMDDIDQQLYQTRWVLVAFAPHQLRQGDDLAIIRDLIAWNVFEVTLVRPNGSDHSLMRASLFFAAAEDSGQSELSLVDFHRRFMDLKRALQCGDGRGKKEILLVMDAHLLTIDDMYALLSWVWRKGSIRHVIMMGATDALPLHTDGQAFVDLINWADYTMLNSDARFDAPAFHQDLLRLTSVALKLDQSLFVCPRLSDLQQCLTGQIRQRRKAVNLLVLVAQHHKKRDASLDAVEHNLTLQYRNAHAVSLRAVTLAELPFLCMTRGYESEWFFFLIGTELLSRLDRNQMNHLFMTVPNLTLLCRPDEYTTAKKKPHKLLRKTIRMQSFPNTRYSLPYVEHCREARAASELCINV